jgi:hypothetical protein
MLYNVRYWNRNYPSLIKLPIVEKSHKNASSVLNRDIKFQMFHEIIEFAIKPGAHLYQAV